MAKLKKSPTTVKTAVKKVASVEVKPVEVESSSKAHSVAGTSARSSLSRANLA